MRKVTVGQKKLIAGRQHFKCANKPGSKLRGLKDYDCPLWLRVNHPGSFDESEYDIDSNLQALCKKCHWVKKYRENDSDNELENDFDNELENDSDNELENDSDNEKSRSM